MASGNPCQVKGCTAQAKPNQLMCWPHWRRVPKALNHAVWETYLNLRFDPAAYREARDAAIEAVESKEAEEKGTPMSARFVLCKFREEDARSYTYESAGIEAAIGDQVKVADRSGDGWKRVFVVGLTDEQPSFPCKPILGKVEPEPAVEPALIPTEGN